MFASISARRRSHHDAAQALEPNPVLDFLRDLDDPDDPWGDAMANLGTLQDALGFDLADGATVTVTPDDGRMHYVLDALGFGVVPNPADGPYDWPTLRETTAYLAEQRDAWLRHAERVMDRRESFARMCGRDY